MSQPSLSPDGTVYVQGYPPGQPMTLLTEQVRAVYPFDPWLSIGRWDDRASWELQPHPDATEDEIAAARAVMAAFDPWGDGADLGVLDAQPDEEDPGEQPEIFDEEDVAAAGEAGEESGDEDADALIAGDPSADASGGAEEDGSVGPSASAYSGIIIERLPDTLGARRNAVLAAIATEKLTRLSIAMDPSRADFLATRFADYQNAGALGLAIDDALRADRDAFLAMKDRTDRITAYALSLERAAIEADSDMLSAMHAGLGDGWP